jgi:hypothetical protein
MHTTLHAAVVSYRQVGLIVTSKMACAGANRYSDNKSPTKTPWMKNPESNRIAEVVSQGRSMTRGESLQWWMVRFGVSHCPTGGWRNRQGTEGSLLLFGLTATSYNECYCTVLGWTRVSHSGFSYTLYCFVVNSRGHPMLQLLVHTCTAGQIL